MTFRGGHGRSAKSKTFVVLFINLGCPAIVDSSPALKLSIVEMIDLENWPQLSLANML